MVEAQYKEGGCCYGFVQQHKAVIGYIWMTAPLMTWAICIDMFGPSFSPDMQRKTFVTAPYLPLTHGVLATSLRWMLFYVSSAGQSNPVGYAALPVEALSHSAENPIDDRANQTAIQSEEGRRLFGVNCFNQLFKRNKIKSFSCLLYAGAFGLETVYRTKTPWLILGWVGWAFREQWYPDFLHYLPKWADDPRVSMAVMAGVFLPTVWAAMTGAFSLLRMDRCFNPGRTAFDAAFEVVKVYFYQMQYITFNALFYTLGRQSTDLLCSHSSLWATIATCTSLLIFSCYEDRGAGPLDFLKPIAKRACCVTDPQDGAPALSLA